jgi:NADP-dependent 3-hydroxy acid dehydrogenase YdfG
MAAGSLAGLRALVTGASRGIGEASALALAGAGARVILAARTVARLEEVAAVTGGEVLPLDLTDAPATLATLRALAEGPDGPPELVVNAAGVFSLAPLHLTGVEELDWNVALNLRGTFLVVRALLPAMRRRGSGLIVNIGSVAGRKAYPGNAAYSASKFGVRGLHEVLQEELRGTGVRATLLEPAASDTPMWDPVNPDDDPDLPDRANMLRASDVAEAVLFVASRPPTVQIPLLQIERS